MNPKRLIPLFVLLALLLAAGGWYYINYYLVDDDTTLTASGTVEAIEVLVASELAGKVAQIYVSEGEVVHEGDPLFELDSALLQAQKERSLTNLAATQAAYAAALQARRTAQSAYNSAQTQYNLVLANARAADALQRRAAWDRDNPIEFDTPAWYFVKSEELAAAENEVSAAAEALAAEQTNFERVRAEASNRDLSNAEKRLAEAQAAFRIAEDVLGRAQAQSNTQLEDYAQSVFDAAEAELTSAQLAYDQILTDQAAEEVLEARARLSVAQERYHTALDYRDSLLTGDESLQVEVAAAALEQAKAQIEQVEANIKQAETLIAQAEAELNLLEVQIEKLTVRAAVAGVVLSRKIEPGEVVQPGTPALTLGQLTDLTLTVYIPEDRYGQVSLGDAAAVTVDSFPGETFNATIIRIADQAEFTPRNVQTAEGRRTTVFGIELAVDDPAGKLKPGMPADVAFGE